MQMSITNWGSSRTSTVILKKAAEHFEKALELNPRYTEVSLNLAVTYNDLGEFNKAQEVFSMAAQIAHPDPNAIDPLLQVSWRMNISGSAISISNLT